MKPDQPQNHGARNLTIFGVIAIAIAILSSGISLFIYSATGDIYLDRSRPGFIPEGETADVDGQTNQDTAFSPDGTVTDQDLAEYLQKLDTLIEEITTDSDAFSAHDLSDEALNITGALDY